MLRKNTTIKESNPTDPRISSDTAPHSLEQNTLLTLQEVQNQALIWAVGVRYQIISPAIHLHEHLNIKPLNDLAHNTWVRLKLD